MTFLRKILFPISLIYWLITWIRNLLYDYQILKSHQFSIPIIAVGNLSVGGTGKSPMIEYLISILQNDYQIGLVSRGYKRKTKGLHLANKKSSVNDLGDEPYQIYKKYHQINLAVDVNRVRAINELIKKTPSELILLDDAFQHRKVKADLYLLLTTYQELFVDDYILPFGNLREPRLGKKRADILIVTKCPEKLSNEEQNQIKKRLKVKCPVFFSKIDYSKQALSYKEQKDLSEIKKTKKIIITGIAKAKPFIDKIKTDNDTVFSYPDHHNFTKSQIKKIKTLSKENLIITTEKDYVRLSPLINTNLFFLPICHRFFTSKTNFDQLIKFKIGKLFKINNNKKQ